MKILQNGIMPGGTEIRIEEWHENYNFMPYGSTIASYPISRASHLDRLFWSRAGEEYRFSFDFKSNNQTKQAFDDLISGKKILSDFKENFSGKREYLNCI